MAAKRKIAKPKPSYDRPWTALTKAQQNTLYVRALNAFSNGEGPNPGSSPTYYRARAAAV
jgi:hypothetical protein